MVVKDVAEVVKKSLYKAHSLDRLAASVFDMLAVVLPVVTLLTALIRQKIKTLILLGNESSVALYLSYSLAIVVVVLFSYQFICNALFSQTLGQKLFGIFVKEKSKNKLSFKASLQRSLIWTLQIIFLGLPLLPMLFKEGLSGFHDKLSNSSVVTFSSYKYKNAISQKMGLMIFAMSILFILATKLSTTAPSNFIAEGSQQCTRGELLIKYDVGSANRLDKLYSLYLLNKISKRCLEEEIELSIYNNRDNDITNLAKADFVKTKNSDLAERYYSKTCTDSKQSYACKVSNYNMSGELFDLDSGAPLFAKIELVKALYEQGESRQVMRALSSIENSEHTHDFKKTYKAKLIWEQDKEKAISLVSEDMDLKYKNSFYIWACNKNIEEGCSEKESFSCKQFSQIETVTSAQHESYELLSLKINVCNARVKDSYKSASAIKLNKTLALPETKMKKALLDIIVKSNHSAHLKATAAHFYLESANDIDEVAPLYIYWMSSHQNQSWNNLGKRIFSKYAEYAKGDKLISVAKLLDSKNSNTLSKKRLAEGYLVAGRLNKAKEIIEEGARVRLPANIESDMVDIKIDSDHRF